MPRVVHFEIPAKDPEAVGAFFEKVFGWKITKWDGPMEYWTITTGEGGPGIDGGLMRRNDPAQPVVTTIEVCDIDETIAKVTEAGCPIVVPKMAIPGIGWLSYFKDPDGNIHGMMQGDPSAA